ncbi:hypothetical protein R5R35_001774 [Gryllus longicercus]|uniref:Uncharacterized protein n=1 Tax=Gryllus longicercus TaxID=2509291 RepID=A0AAN9ZF15_9ORTH
MANQFDAALGGSIQIPGHISTAVFAQARCQEIEALNNALEQAQKGGLIFQRLPKAMRRRVMSHHSKRMPRRLREAHTKQLEKNGVPPKTKCPSRKYRRRPQNLLLEYNRRQRNFIWLETHIWHAKRFHMTEKWGYKLARFPNAKTFRACYRASANHCLLQDISYYCCMEIKGPEIELIEGLKKHVSSAVGLTFGAQAFISGCKEGHTTFYYKDKFPFGAVGAVQFLWKAENGSSTEQRILWLWTHPSIYNEVKNCLIETFALGEEMLPEKLSEDVGSQFSMVEIKKLEAHCVLEAYPKYISSDNRICLILLKDKLNRFRLTGPLSHSILVDTLNVTSFAEKDKLFDIFETEDVEFLNSDSDFESPEDTIAQREDADVNDNKRISSDSEMWWKTYYRSNEVAQKAHFLQADFWRAIRGSYSASQFPPHQVVALTVLDPRYQLPSKRVKIVPDSKVPFQPERHTSLFKSISISPIWSSEVRMATCTSKLSQSEWEKHRAQKVLVPGISEGEINCAKTLNLEKSNGFEPSCIPILLVQRPGSQDSQQKRLGFSSGWDIIFPAGWAMPFWIALIFRGAKPGGLKEASMVQFETGSVTLTEPFAPDTAAGKTEAEANRREREQQHFRLPPNKRPNFIKFGIASPFSCCWDILLNDWCQNKHKDIDASFYVLREKVKLDALKCIINNSFKSGSNVNGGTRADQISHFSSLFSNMNHNCLIPVRIESVKRGCPADCALICIPSSDDILHSKENSAWEGPVEPIHNDNKSDQRKTLRNQHKKELRRLRKQRVLSNNKLKKQMDMLLEKGESISHLISLKKEKTPTKDFVDKHAEEMKLLWIPEPKTIKDSCSRTVVGFVCKGDFSFSEAHGVGLGYVPLPALVHLINTWTEKPLVLFRNPNSLQYYYAVLKIF